MEVLKFAILPAELAQTEQRLNSAAAGWGGSMLSHLQKL
jgi:hypothetical protein